jgi:hypothetical protein
MSFDVAKWNKQRYLAEAGLLESTADLTANAINGAIDSVDKNLSYKDFALAVAKILKEEYGSQNFGPFMEVLSTELGMSNMEEGYLPQSTLDDYYKNLSASATEEDFSKLGDEELLSTYEKKLKSHDWFYMMSDDDRTYKRGDAEKGTLIKIKKELEGRGLADEAKRLLAQYEKKPF